MRVGGLLAAFALVLLGHSKTWASQYNLIDLNALLGSNAGFGSSAVSINNTGQVTGTAINSTGTNSAQVYIYDGTAVHTLGPLITQGGSMGATSGSSINAAGHVVGSANIGVTDRGYLYTGGALQDLGLLPTWTDMYANGINDSDQIVGSGHVPDGNYHAFLYSGGVKTDIGTLAPGYSALANSINNLGQIVGEANSPTAGYHAFRYSNGVMQDLGVLPGGRTSTGTAINNLGHVVGQADNNLRNEQAFIWTGSTLQDLGTLGGTTSSANGINGLDQVVGWSLVSPSVQHAFLYSGGTMQDLNSLIDPASGWKITDAIAINDSGEIVGNGTDPQGHSSAFLLVPTPEPGTCALLTLATGGLLIRRRRQGR